jgi:hypothetical protein
VVNLWCFPEAISDGNIETSWRYMGESQEEEGWLELDFGQARPVGRIRILWWQRDEASYTIELSKDRETWQTVAENRADKTQILHAGQEHGFSPMTFVSGLNTGARYLRIRANGPKTVKRINVQGVPRIGWLCGNKWGIVQRNDLAEIYLDDYQLYIMHLRKRPTGRLGFFTSGGQTVIENVKAWYADPNATK